MDSNGRRNTGTTSKTDVDTDGNTNTVTEEPSQSSSNNEILALTATVSAINLDDDSTLVEIHACGICYMRYDEAVRVPKVLTCGHTYCFICLKSIARLKGSRVSCPSCRKPTGVSYKALPSNFQLLDLIRKMGFIEIREPVAEDEPVVAEDLIQGIVEEGEERERERGMGALGALMEEDSSDDDDYIAGGDDHLFGVLDVDRSVQSARDLIREVQGVIGHNWHLLPEEQETMRATVMRLEGVVTDLRDLETRYIDGLEEIRDIKDTHRDMVRMVNLRNGGGPPTPGGPGNWELANPGNAAVGRDAYRFTSDEDEYLYDDDESHSGTRRAVDGDTRDRNYQLLLDLVTNQRIADSTANSRESPTPWNYNDEDLFQYNAQLHSLWAEEDDGWSDERDYESSEERVSRQGRSETDTYTVAGGDDLVIVENGTNAYCTICECSIPSGARNRATHLNGRRHRMQSGHVTFPMPSSGGGDPNPMLPQAPIVPSRFRLNSSDFDLHRVGVHPHAHNNSPSNHGSRGRHAVGRGRGGGAGAGSGSGGRGRGRGMATANQQRGGGASGSGQQQPPQRGGFRGRQWGTQFSNATRSARPAVRSWQDAVGSVQMEWGLGGGGGGGGTVIGGLHLSMLPPAAFVPPGYQFFSSSSASYLDHPQHRPEYFMNMNRGSRLPLWQGNNV